MCHLGTGVSSTLATRSAVPSGAHQYPRVRPISSAATNSARPNVTPLAPSGPMSRESSPVSSVTTRTAPSRT